MTDSTTQTAGEKRYPCGWCDYVAKTFEDFCRHIDTHAPDDAPKGDG
jgi:uncharacterized C2H2 Zn-finger protein